MQARSTTRRRRAGIRGFLLVALLSACAKSPAPGAAVDADAVVSVDLPGNLRGGWA